MGLAVGSRCTPTDGGWPSHCLLFAHTPGLWATSAVAEKEPTLRPLRLPRWSPACLVPPAHAFPAQAALLMPLTGHRRTRTLPPSSTVRDACLDPLPPSQGTYVKKEQYLKQAFDPIQRLAVTATRTRTAARSFELRPAEAKEFLLTRFWRGEGPGPGVSQ
jgi:hypothetical protein